MVERPSGTSQNGLPAPAVTVIGINAQTISHAFSVTEFRMNDIRPRTALRNSADQECSDTTGRLADLHQNAEFQEARAAGP